MMNRSWLRGAFLVVFLAVAAWALAAGEQQPGDYVPGQVIIKLNPSTPPADALAVRTSLNATVERRFKSVGAELWKTSGIDVPTAVSRFKNDPRVAYIEPNYIVHAEDVFPNDPRFAEMWALHNIGQTGGTPDADIDAPEAWSIETGDTVLVGVIDTGVDWHHVELAANIFTNPGEIADNGIDDDGNGYIDDIHGWDFVNNDNDPYDDHGHGTHVSGTIAASGNNGVGVVGVSWSARILPLKFLDSGGSGSTSGAILAVEYATSIGARLTNNSWGGGGYSEALRDAIEAAGNAGVLFVAAAGNSGDNNDLYPHYPSSYDLDNIIAVASTDHNDQMSGFSCYGLTSVDLGAPGSDILSTFPGNTYGTISGTSMATPHVSGAVSLLWSTAPLMTHLEIKEAILASVDPIAALAGKTVTGGRLNINNMMSGLDSIPPARVGNLAVQSTGSNTATLTWTATGDDGSQGTASLYDLRYSTSGIYWSNFEAATPAQGEPQPKPAGSPESFTLTGLDFNTKYFFGMVVEDEQGNRSWLSNLPNGTTLGIPQLTYSPDSFAASLLTGGSLVQQLTIGNTAEGTLDFSFPGALVQSSGAQGAPAAFPTWLRVTPSSGRVYAGESLIVEVAFDATGMYGGDYAEVITLETNDPAHAAVPIPVSLHVTSAPDVAIAPSAIDFGPRYTGTCVTDTVVVTNIGTEPLVVSGLTIDNGEFSADPSGFVLGIGESRMVFVTFCPVTIGVIEGTLSIQSNDPDHPTYTVSLRGEGDAPPVISVSPGSFSEDLYTGQTAMHTLAISNSGGSNLEFDITTEKVDLLGASAVVRTRINVPRSSGEFPRGTYEPTAGRAPENGRAAGSALTDAAAPLGATGSSFSTETGFNQATRFSLDTPEVLNFVGAVPAFIWAGDFGVGDNAFAYALNDMNEFMRIDTLNGAQTILGTLTPYGGETWTGMALDSADGLMYATSTNIGSSSLYVIDVGVPSVTRIGSMGFAGIIALAVDKDGNMYAEDIVTDELVAVNKATGAGTAIGSLGFDANFGQGMAFDPVREELYLAAFNNYTFQAELRIADRTTGATALVGVLGQTSPGGTVQLGWLGIPGLGGVQWLVVGPPDSGIVPPGASMDVAVEFDATGMNGGDYDADILIANNDPLRPVVTVPAHLHVTGAPDIAVSETLLDYGPVFIGAVVGKTVVVKNEGTDQLVVSSVASSLAEYTVDVSSFALSPGESQNVVVSFAPTAVASYPGTLTITSNDPDEPVVQVALAGEGVEPPVISISCDSPLSEDLYTGETATHVCTISNSGGSNLEFDISMEELGGGAVEVFGGPVEGSGVVQVGRPLKADELARVKASFPKSVVVGKSGEIDKGAPSVKGEGKASSLDRVGREGLVEEVFGSADNQFTAGPRSRGNLFTCTTATTLVEHRLYMNATTPTQLWFLVYEGLSQAGTYNLISASDVTPAGPGLGWYSSGEVSVPMEAGRYYLIVGSFEQSSSYYNQQNISPYPIAASFGELTAGAGWSWAPTSDFPPAPYQDVPLEAFGEPVAYYQTLVTGSAVKWLSVAPEQGTVVPGASMDMAVTFDASGMYGGDYDANILIANNDPLRPVVTLPAHLHVTGAPDIAVSETLLDYGPVFIGAVVGKTVVVKNEGTDQLVVSSVAPSLAEYTVDVSSFTVAPGESQNVVVSFAPTAVASYPGTLTITSNDVDEGTVDVLLQGEGVEPPIIAVTPQSLSDSLFTGETSTHVLTISNNGGSPLEFDISRENLSSASVAASDAVSLGQGRSAERGNRGAVAQVAAIQPRDGSNSRTPYDQQRITPIRPAVSAGETAILVIQNWSAWGVDMWSFILNEFGIASTLINSSQIPETDFSPFDLVITTGSQGWDYYNALSTNVAKFENFVAGGGVVQYQGATQGDNIDIVGGVDVLFGNSETYNTVLAPSHPIVQGLPPQLEGNAANHTYLVNLPGNAVVITQTTDSQVPTTVEYKYGGGTVIATGMTWEYLYNYGYVAGAMLRNAVAYSMSLAGVPWLSVSPSVGTVLPGTSLDLQVTFDAAGMNGGDYDANIRILNNDPLNPEPAVPAYLHVTGAPDIAVSDTVLNYGPVFIGAAVTDTLVVSNEGTDELAVSGISSSDGDYTVDVTSFTLAPGASQPVTVTFAPTTAGPIPGTVTITSNDPDEPVVEVDLWGEGLVPPVISVTPESLSDSLFTGETSTHPLTISNAGGSDLDFSIAIGESTLVQSIAILGSGTGASAGGSAAADRNAGHASAVSLTPAVPLIEISRGQQDTRTYPPMNRASGGPDPFGYRWRDSNETGGPSFEWIDVSGGTPITLGDFDFRGGIPLGFTFVYYGQAFTTIGVGSKGWLSFNGSNTWFPSNVPQMDDFAGAIAPYARDLYPPGGTYVRYQTFGTAPSRRFVVEYNNIPDYPSGGFKTFEVVFYERTNAIRFQYLVAPNDPYGFGIESPDQTMGMGNAGAGSLFISPALVEDNYAIEFVEAPVWLGVDLWAGTVPAGESLDLVVTMDATGMIGGDNYANLLIASNDPITPVVPVPAYLHVTGAPDIALSDSTLDFGTLFVGATTSRVIVVFNSGTDQLVVDEITSTNPDVTVSPQSFAVPVSGSQDLTVTFAPTAPGAVSGTVTVSSNDPDEGEVPIDFVGMALVPPAIVVSPESVSEALNSGETSTQTLMIGNPGGSPLGFSIAVIPAGLAASADAASTGAAIPVLPPKARSGSPSVNPMIEATTESETEVSWLTLNPTFGTVDPAGSQEITLNFSAVALMGGLYQAYIVITTNVPATPTVSVPVEFDVTGVPAIAVSDTTLDFGVVFLGYTRTMQFVVSNLGSETLAVSDISADHPAFSVVPASFNLAPLGAQNVSVDYTPTETEVVTGLLTIASNDPDTPAFQIDLTAEALSPPIVSVSPESIELALETGQTTLDTIYVSNTGGSALTWDSEVAIPLAMIATARRDSETAEPLSSLQVLWHGDHGWGGIAWWSVIVSYLTSHGATVTESNAPIDDALLAGVDIIWFGTRDVPFTTAELNALFSWITGGGHVLIEADTEGSRAVYNELLDTLGSSIAYLPFAGVGGLTPNIFPHETTAGVDEIYLMSPQNILNTWPPAAPLVADMLPPGRTVIAYDIVGEGRLIVMADHTFHDLAINSGDNRVFAIQVFEWFGASRWLSLEPAFGTLDPGETVMVEALIDATLLAPGDYELNAVFHSNDPATPSVIVPVSLTVTPGGATTGIDPDDIPTRYELHANHPNPFNPTTTIAYDLPKDSAVRLVIYDVSGRGIRELVNSSEPQGRRQVVWDGRNASGEPVASGVYFYRLVAGDFVQTRKMVLLK